MFDLQRFLRGTEGEAYRLLGPQLHVDGSYTLRVFAPEAQRVWLCGELAEFLLASEDGPGEGGLSSAREGACASGPQNGAPGSAVPMEAEGQGFYCLDLPAEAGGRSYHFYREDESGAEALPDLFGRQQVPASALEMCLPRREDEYWDWGDADYLARRPRHDAARPICIYQLHLGSWRRHEDGRALSYAELAQELPDYVRGCGFTHVQVVGLAGLTEDDWQDGSGPHFFAPSPLYGRPADFKQLVDALHQAGLGLILDWNVAGLCSRFTTGKSLQSSHGYLHELRAGASSAGGRQYYLDFQRGDFCSFLLSSALFWLRSYHVDGLALSQLGTLLYGLDELQTGYASAEAELRPGARAFFRHWNRSLHSLHQDVLTLAADGKMERGQLGLTRPVEEGGLGFSRCYNGSWTQDQLDYFSCEYSQRPYRHHKLTDSMLDAFDIRGLLALDRSCFDHGQASLLAQMPGDYWRSFASLRCLLAHQLAHPGAKLLFMGQELGQVGIWRFREALDWRLLKYDMHQRFHSYLARIQKLYQENPVLWKADEDWSGFRWLEADDLERCVFSYMRMAEGCRPLLVILNMLPTPIDHFRLAVPDPGRYEIILDSDAADFGGSDYDTGAYSRALYAEPVAMSGLPYSIRFNLPPLAALWLRRQED